MLTFLKFFMSTLNCSLNFKVFKVIDAGQINIINKKPKSLKLRKTKIQFHMNKCIVHYNKMYAFKQI